MCRIPVLAVALVVGATVAVAPAPPALAVAKPASMIQFLVTREGNGIGRHDIQFHRDGDDLIVDIAVKIEVKFFFSTIFEFSHKTREVWRDDRLIALESVTEKDGEMSRVSGRAVADGFKVETDVGSYIVPPDIVPASYWHPRTARQDWLLDTQTGKLIHVKVHRKGTEPVDTPDGIVMSRAYEIEGDVRVTVWYDTQDRLTKVTFLAPDDGSVIEYQRKL